MVSPVKPLFRLQNYSCLKVTPTAMLITNSKLTITIITEAKGHVYFQLPGSTAVLSLLELVVHPEVKAAFTQFEMASSLYDLVLTRQKAGQSVGLFSDRTDILDALVCHETWKICDLQNQFHHDFYPLHDLYTYNLHLLRELRQQMLELYSGDSLYK